MMFSWSLREDSCGTKEAPMFWNIYRKYILRAVRSREMIGWTLLFPILLSTLFYFSLGSLDEDMEFQSIPAAVVENRAMETEGYLKQMLEEISKGGEPLLDLCRVSSEEEADTLLKNDEICGYIFMEGRDPRLYVKENGIYQTILKNLLDSYIQTKDAVITIAGKDPVSALKLAKRAAGGKRDGEDLTPSREFIRDLELTGKKPSATVNYYYALLAMICLYGGFHGLVVVENLQANLSPQGARNTLSPGSRWKLFLASYLGALTVQFLCVAVSFFYMGFVLKVNFGTSPCAALGTILAGSMTGISFGSVVALPPKWKGGMKSGVLVGVSMICCFFAGLMIDGISYIVKTNMPILAAVNPAARIADAFYCLYYYEGYTRYFQNIGMLLGMAVIFGGICVIATRRVQYESI